MLEVNEFPVEPGDVYLMCSDGLSDMVSDELIVRIAREDLRLEPLAEHLIHAANENGGRDNISVVLVAVGEAAEKKGFIAKLLGK
jgi:protein phosphatase